jgi:hypothetical protein
MQKRTERHVRKVKDTLATPAARSARERILAQGPHGNGRPASATTMAALPSAAPGAWGGSTTKDATGQTGTPGNLNVFGFLTGEDYNPDLDGFPMFANYNKMRLGDAQVNATLLMLKLPLKGATWIAKPASDDAQDKAIADFIQANLIDDDALARTWQHVLDNAMLKFDFGCAAAEIVWGLRDEADGVPFATVTDLAPRISAAHVLPLGRRPEDGKLASCSSSRRRTGSTASGTSERRPLPARARARGQQLLRPLVLRSAYPHWWWKQQLYRIDMIGHDRFHVGIPRAKLDENYNALTAPLDKIERRSRPALARPRVHGAAVRRDVRRLGQAHGRRHRHSGHPAVDRASQPDDRAQHPAVVRRPGRAAARIVRRREGHERRVLRRAAGRGRRDRVGAEARRREAHVRSELRHARAEVSDARVHGHLGGRLRRLATAMAALAEKGLITPDDDLEVVAARSCRRARNCPTRSKAAMPRHRWDRQPRRRRPTPAIRRRRSPRPSWSRPNARRSSRRRPHVRPRAVGPLERRSSTCTACPRRSSSSRARLVHELAAIRREQLRIVAERIAQKDAARRRPTSPTCGTRTSRSRRCPTS